ncbi:IclR family transcriptional regulator [Halomicroarcula sp. GCM10025709]|uniref:IclR family transcriptional regulator n=1 Tax=Haloarcula TaxID=2237 RepID=UPI0024C399F6|nr:IclR family transcriptional regulator [Halomicroarcula sp. YJ-61-S]
MSDTPSYTIDATETSLDLLELLVQSADPMGVTALADRLGVAKSVVYNHLATLRERGYVVKRGDRYEPSLKPLDVGSQTRAAMPIYESARHHLDNLAAASGETTVLFVLEAGSGVPVYIAEASDGWSPRFHEGQRYPLHVNAPGKAILASLPEERVDEILAATDLVAPTEATITRRDELKATLRGVREDTVAFCRGEQYEGIVGAAAPVSVSDADCVAALGICGPVDRLSGRYLEEDITGQVVSTAKSIQVDLRSR